MNDIIARLESLARRHQHIVFDLRGDCRVMYGIAAAYRRDERIAGQPILVLAEALEQDGVVSVNVDPHTCEVIYERCRLFTAQEQAMRFAKEQGRTSIYNLNRACEMPLPHTLPTASALPTT